MEVPYRSYHVCGDACEVVVFKLVSPPNGATLTYLPTFKCTSGFPLSLPSFWNIFATHYPCIWLVIGYDTNTQAWNVIDPSRATRSSLRQQRTKGRVSALPFVLVHQYIVYANYSCYQGHQPGSRIFTLLNVWCLIFL
jgi:hypothetical protein